MDSTRRRARPFAIGAAALCAALTVNAARRDPLSPMPAPTAPTAVGQTASSVDLCELLSFAASADPALQYASGQPPDAIDAVAAIQRRVLLATVDLLGPGPHADALAALADAFVDENGRGPGAWSEDRWSAALIARGDPERLPLLTDLEADCG